MPSASTTSAADSRCAPARPAPRRSTTWPRRCGGPGSGRRATSRPSAASRCWRSRRSRSGAGRPFETYLVRGLDAPFLEHTTFGLGDIARGYDSEQEVWDALRTRPGLAVVDSTIVPRRDNWNFGVPPDFQLSGFYFEEGVRPDPDRGPRQADRAPRPADRHRDPQGHRTAGDGRHLDLGEDARRRVPGPHPADDPLLRARPRASTPRARPRELETAFLASGLEAESIQQVVDDAARRAASPSTG